MHIEALAVVGFQVCNHLSNGLEILVAHLRAALDTNRTLVSCPVTCMPGDVLDLHKLGAAACLRHKVGRGAGAASKELADLLETLVVIAPVMDDDGIDVVDGAVCLGERGGVVLGDVLIFHMSLLLKC